MSNSKSIKPITSHSVDRLMNLLGLTLVEFLYLLGMSTQTLKTMKQNPTTQIRTSYALLIRLLSYHPDLCPFKPMPSMREFHGFLVNRNCIARNDHAGIILGQQKTWYYRSVELDKMVPTASHLASLYMRKIDEDPVSGYDYIRQLVETESHSRGLREDQIWTLGQWPRNTPNKGKVIQPPKNAPAPITGADIALYKDIAGLPTHQDLAFIYGIALHRLSGLLSSAEPLYLSATTCLLTRFLLDHPQMQPFALPRPTPVEIYDFFMKEGGYTEGQTAVILGLKPESSEQMLTHNKTTPTTYRLAHLLMTEHKKRPGILKHYRTVVNDEAMSRGMKSNEIFVKRWPVIPTKKP